MASQLTAKVAIVTGSSSGFGEAIAILFASRGAKVTISGRNQERLKSVLDKVVEANGGNKNNVLAISGDLKDSHFRKEIIQKTVDKFGRLDILVANAGVAGDCYNSIVETSEESYDNILDTNLKATFFLMQHAVPHLEKTRGNIVSISSVGSSTVIPAFTTYSLTKAALDHLTRCLAVDLGHKGIRVNTVNPAYIATLLLREFHDANQIDSEMQVREKNLQPLKGVDGGWTDVAETVAFLASDAARFITGECIKVDGGRSYSGVMAFPPRQGSH